MPYLGDAIADAAFLIATGDSDVLAAVWASMRFALTSTVLGSAFGIPLGAALALYKVPFQRVWVALMHTLLALPTVVAGLLIYTLLFRQGPLGAYGMLFTPAAIVMGQVVLVTPIVAAFTHTAVDAVDPTVRATALTLGASPTMAAWTVLREARTGVLAACIASFGRVVGEVGVSMMLGGNIAGYTRTITTVIALETRKGEFTLALALGVILMIVAFGVNLSVRLLGDPK